MSSKKYFIFLLVFLVVTDLTIFFDIPGLRQIFSFLCLSILPGWLILQILHLNNLDLTKRLVLSLGISISFLMFGGLLLNFLYPFISAPLSWGPLLIAFNVTALILLFIAYWRNRDDFVTGYSIDIKTGIFDINLPFIVFPVLFPLLAICGTYLMNIYANNSVLMLLIGLIPLYILTLVIYRNKIASHVFPLAIWMIALSILLMRGLTSNHILGTDIFGEFYFFQLTANNAHWNISDVTQAYDSCLSVTILPTIYHALLNINPEYIFKVIPEIIVSAIPVALYLITKTYLGAFRGFLGALLIIFQFAFIMTLVDATRTGIAVLFLGLLVLVLIEREIVGPRKIILFIIFGASAIVAHYSTGYTLVLWLLALVILALAIKLFQRKHFAQGQRETVTFVTAGIAVLFLVILFLWYSQLTRVPFAGATYFIKKTFENLINFAILESRDFTLGKLAGIGISSIPSLITTISHGIMFLLITIGVISLVKNYKTYLDKGFHFEYILSSFIFFAVLVALMALPYVSIGYDTGRSFVTALFFLAPAFIIGGETVARILRRLAWSPFILCILLILQYTCALQIPYHVFHMPVSPYYEASGPGRDLYYIYDKEINSSKWFIQNEKHPSSIYGDFVAWPRLLLATGTDTSKFQVGFIDESIYEKEFKIILYYTNKQIENGDYIYLGNANIPQGIIYLDFQLHTRAINEYTELINNTNRIYTNGGSEIWRYK